MIFLIKDIVLESFGTGQDIKNYIQSQRIDNFQKLKQKRLSDIKNQKLELQARIANNIALQNAYSNPTKITEPKINDLESINKIVKPSIPPKDMSNPYNRVNDSLRTNSFTINA